MCLYEIQKYEMEKNVVASAIVQLGSKLQSSVEVLAQSRTLYLLCYPPTTPTTTENFLKGFSPNRRLIFGI